MSVPARFKIRSGSRVASFLSVRMTFDQRRLARISIWNISARGFRATTPVPVHRGDLVLVDLPHLGVVSARVAWEGEGKFGAMFSASVDFQGCLRAVAG
jgi:hypothetical protein